MARINYTPTKDVAAVNEAARLAQTGAPGAALRLVEITAPMVFSLAKRRGFKLPREDVESVAHTAVMYALTLYDHEREGAAFSGLLATVALGMLDEETLRSSGPISMGTGTRSKRIRIYARRFIAEAKKAGANEEEAIAIAAERMDVNPDAIAAYFAMFNTVGDDTPEMLNLTTADAGPVEGIQDRQRAALVEEAIEALGPRLGLIMRRTMEGVSQREIGAEMDLSGERVRQLLDVAKPRFLRFFKKRGLSLHDLV